MAEPRQPRATEEDTHMADLPPYPGIPRWVKVCGIIGIVLVLLIAIVMFTGVGGEHGPWRHMGHKVSTALVATYRPVTLVATQRPVVLAATYRPRQSPSGHVSSRTR
jgi:hypothetical protein